MDRLEQSVPQSLGPQWVPQSLGAAAANHLERSVPQSLGAQWAPQSPEIVKCTKCGGQGSRGLFICKSHCHCCGGTGEGSKAQLLGLLNNMRLGDVDAAVVLQAISAEKRNDIDIVLAAVGRFPKAFQFVSERLKANQEVIDAAAAATAALKKDILDRSLTRSLRKSPSGQSLNKFSSCDWSQASTATCASASQRLSELPEETAAEWCSLS